MSSTTEDISSVEALDVAQNEESSDILNAAEPTDLSAADDSAQEKLENRVKGKNFAFREWVFEFLPKYVAQNFQLILEMKYVADNIALTPTEKIIFEKALAALQALIVIQKAIVEQLAAISLDDFSQKSEEEQVDIISGLYNETYLTALKEAAFPAFNLSRYLDRIFRSHLEKIQALPGKESFALLRREANFEIQARIMQGLTRDHMLASAVRPYLESTKTEFPKLCNALGEIPMHVNELDRINALCHNHNVQNADNIGKSDRNDFLEDKKAEQFLSFLGEDKQKIAYFKLLQKMHAQGPKMFRENFRKSVLSLVGLTNVEEIKRLFPFFAQSLDELLKSAKGNEQQLSLAVNTINSLLWDVLEPDFAAFTKRMEHTKPQENSGFELTEEVAVIPAELAKANNSSKPKLERSKSEPQLKKQQSSPQLRKSASMGDLIGKTKAIGETVVSRVQSTMQTLFRPNEKLDNKVKLEAITPVMSFTEHARMAVEAVHVFQELEKQYKNTSDLASEKRAQIEGWQAVYKRRKPEQTEQGKEQTEHDKDQSVESLHDTIPHDGFRAGDSVEILHKGKTAFEITPADENNETNGVKVTVPSDGHNEENIEVAVLYMVRALAKKGQKEVCIGIDLNVPGFDEIALLYANTILGKNAIPIFKLEGKRLSREETKEKLKEIYSRITDETTKKKYMKLVEKYECDVERIESQQKEDARFLKAFEKFMQIPGLTVQSYMKNLSAKKKLMMGDIASKLGRITLISRNLAEDKFLETIVKYVYKMHADKGIVLTEKDLDAIKSKLKDHFNFCIAKDPHSTPDTDRLTMELFSIAFTQIKGRMDEYAAFVAEFDKLLQQPELLAENPAITMQDPNIKETLNLQQILTRLAQVTFENKAMSKEEFIDRAFAFGLATLAPSARAAVTNEDIADLKKALEEKVRLHMDHLDGKRDDGLFATHLIEFAQKELIPGNSSKMLSGRHSFISGTTCAESVPKHEVAPQPVEGLVHVH